MPGKAAASLVEHGKESEDFKVLMADTVLEACVHYLSRTADQTNQKI
jgi:hypothetical protein